jgi:hypothetical protein
MDSTVVAGPQGPALTGTDDEVLIQALRNLWPILDKASRAKAIRIAADMPN